MKHEKKSAYDTGKINRGIVTWMILLSICVLIWVSDTHWILYLYLAISMSLLAVLYIRNRIKGRNNAFSDAVRRFLSEVGGGF